MGNKVKEFVSVASCKLTRFAIRSMHRGGTTTPGQIAMKFDNEILKVVSHGMDVIVVTGTNGKTTTSHMIEEAMTKAGHDCLANKSGANLLPGITAEFVCSATMSGKPTKKYAVIECDEAALKHVVPLLKPKVIVVTNLFRDQLDRYGEVMNTLNEILTAVKKVPKTVLCLNADDSLVASIASKVSNRSVFFGIGTPVGPQKNVEISDAKYCINCGTEYRYSYHTYAHLGGFYCPKCGYKRPKADVEVEKIVRSSFSGSTVRIDVRGKKAEFNINLPAVYNIYNAIAALCGYMAFGMPGKEMIRALRDIKSSFGRMENFDLNGNPVQMILVKNPAGCNQVIEYLSEIEEDIALVFGLNDRAPDGHDISWIWDVDFEAIVPLWKAKRIIVTGDRAEDMMLRLKYAGVPEESMLIEKDIKKLIESLGEIGMPAFIMPNYTAMLDVRAVLAEVTGSREFWKG